MGGGTGNGELPKNAQRKLEGIVDDFIICPVRKMSTEEDTLIKEHISKLELEGRAVHYPPRDTNQDDPIGLNICTENRNAIKKAERVHIYYNPTSTGTVFDLGMTFMARKPLIVINELPVFDENDRVLFFILKYAEKVDYSPEFYQGMQKKLEEIERPYQNILKRRDEIEKAKIIEYKWKGNTKEFLFDLGMTFMAKRTISIINRGELAKCRTPCKSFENVLLAIDKRYEMQ